jgi:hypothetical protein
LSGNATSATTVASITSGQVTSALGYTPSNSATSTNSFISQDSRSTNYAPSARSAGLYADFIANSTDGLSDGGTYHGVLTFRSYGSGTDLSGGQVQEIAYTDNNNLWHRISAGASTWGSWIKVLDSNNYNSYAPTLTGTGASGTWGINITGSAGSAGSVDYANLTNKTGGTGTYTTSGDYRAPIFYDSNNTGYYVDPATSSLVYNMYANGQLSGGYNVGRPSSLNGSNWAARIGATDVFLVMNSLDGTASYASAIQSMRTSDSASFPLFLNPNGGNVGINTPTAASAQLHVRASSPSGIGGLPSGVTMLSDSSTNNYLLFRNTADNGTYSGIAFQDNNMGGYVIFGNAGVGDQMYIAGYGGGQLQYGSADSISPGARTTTASWSSSGFSVNSGGFYAPIFYDSNDTGYYVDPNSNSKLYGLQLLGSTAFDGSTTLNVTNNAYVYGRAQITITGRLDNGNDGWSLSNGRTQLLFNVNNGGSQGSTGTTNFSFQYNMAVSQLGLLTANNTTAPAIYWSTGNSNTYLNGGLYAPIFYDIDNTAYYVNPNGASNLASYVNFGSYIDVAGALYTRDYYYILNAAGNGWNTVINRNGGNSWIVYGGDSVRAPIFYDNDDTNYYCNPNGVSRLNEVRATLLEFGGDAAYTFRADAWAGTGGYPGYSYTGGTSRFGFSSTGGYIDLYIDGNFYGGIDLYGANRLVPLFDANQGGGALYSSIVYDTNNTGYYCDPSGLSSFNSLSISTINSRGAGNLMYYQGFTLDANTMDTNSTGFTYAVNAPAVGPVARFSTGGGYDMWLNAAYSGGGNTLYFRTRNGDAGSINSWKALASYGVNYGDSLYATILYDANNTGYYCDPTATSYMSGATFVGNITVSAGNATGGGIILADDGDIVDLNDGYCSMRFSYGVRVFSGNRTGSAQVALTYQGNVIAAGNVTAYGSPSDSRLKENVKPLTGALGKVMQLQGCTFDWKEDSEQHTMVGLREDIGFIADDVKEVVPNMVRMGQDGYLSLRDRGFSALLVEAMKEQQAQIAALRAEINALRAH